MPDNSAVIKRLEELEDHLTKWLANQNKDAAEFRTKMYSALFGDVEDQQDKPGLFGRISRLEQWQLMEDKKEDRKSTWGLVLWGAVITEAVAQVWNWIKK